MANKGARVPRDMRTAETLAKRLGWTVERKRGSNHFVWQRPDGHKVFLPSTPRGGRRSIENSIALLRRNGLPV